MEDLFIEPELHFEKSASEVQLPEDANAWPNEILQELYKQVPYIADFEPHVVMDRVEAEKGYGFGHVEIGNKTEMLPGTDPNQQASAGVHQVRVPVIITGLKLQPFDVLVTEDSKMFPLTESRLRQALFRPQAFDITSRTPGDQSLIGQLYPPYRQNYGFGGGGATMSAGMGKEGSARRGSLLEAVLPTANTTDVEKVAMQIFEDSNLQALYLQNSHSTAASLQKLAQEPNRTTEKISAAIPHLIKPTVIQLTKEASGYKIKAANHSMWAPVIQEIDRGEAVRRFGGKVVLAADMTSGVTMTEGAEAQEAPNTPEGGGDPLMEETPELITEYGLYKVHDLEGQEIVGWVFPNLLDIDGTSLPLALFTNGSVSTVQGEIVGCKAGEGQALPVGRHPQGHGIFYRITPDGAEATLPFDMQGSFSAEGEMSMQATTFEGNPVSVVAGQPNIQQITVEGDTVLIPEDFNWMPLDKSNEVALASSPEEAGAKEAAVKSFASVIVRASGADGFSFDGMAVDKLASAEKNFLNLNEALFLLGALGVESDYGQRKLASAMYWSDPVRIRIGRFIEPASYVQADIFEKAKLAAAEFPNWRKNLVKEAAVIPDPVAVDSVLSLGFLNPENISTFVSHLPILDQAQERMCELLIAARLGMREIPTGALERAIKSAEEVIEGLKVMAFQQN